MERNVNKPVSVNWYFHCGVMEEIIFSADCFQLTNQQTDLKTGFFSINTWCRFCYSVASSKLLFYFFIVSCYHNMLTTTLRALTQYNDFQYKGCVKYSTFTNTVSYYILRERYWFNLVYFASSFHFWTAQHDYEPCLYFGYLDFESTSQKVWWN